MRSPWLLVALTAVPLLSGCTQTQKLDASSTSPAAPAYDPARYTTGSFEGCPPEGSGGDSALNRLKNRDLPPASFEPLTAAQVLALPAAGAGAASEEPRSQWPEAARERITAWESKGAAVEGYLTDLEQAEPESCNCDSPRRRDLMLWIAAAPEDGKQRAFVAEVSPRLHPAGWSEETLRQLSRKHARVRVSGWLMWDHEEQRELGDDRGTLWEVHPVHRIEIQRNGEWVAL